VIILQWLLHYYAHSKCYKSFLYHNGNDLQGLLQENNLMGLKQPYDYLSIRQSQPIFDV